MREFGLDRELKGFKGKVQCSNRLHKLEHVLDSTSENQRGRERTDISSKWLWALCQCALPYDT